MPSIERVRGSWKYLLKAIIEFGVAFVWSLSSAKFCFATVIASLAFQLPLDQVLEHFYVGNTQGSAWTR